MRTGICRKCGQPTAERRNKRPSFREAVYAFAKPESDKALRRGKAYPTELLDFDRLELGLIRDPWNRPSWWRRDMVTIRQIKERIELERRIEIAALGLGAKLR